jgi:soluble lytic murein transglycosylase-like protein
VLALLSLLLAGTVAAAGPPDRPLAQFPGLARVFRELSSGAGGDAAAGRLFDFEQVLVAVAGRPGAAGHSLEEYRRAFAGELGVALPADRGAAVRDDTAYRLLGLGYSAREIADILAGRISRRALDDAQKMLMMGQPADRVSDVLDREYRRVADVRERAERERLARRAAPAAIESLVTWQAARHGVDAALVRAVIAAESGWNPAARSRAGAIGLMQLMPGTARELGVDPLDPSQNVEGGVRYLAWLLQAFGSAERALIAYNAGPGFAQRFVRGEVALYGETRDYVRRVLALLPGVRR